MLQHLIDFFITYGYFAVFGVLILCGMGIPVPEDITLVAGGAIAAMSCAGQDDVSTWLLVKECTQVHIMFFVAMAGVLIGDGMMYGVGYYFGDKISKIPGIKKIVTPERYAWVQEKFTKYGVGFIFGARFMPGLRTPIFIITGVTRKIPYWLFLLTDGLAALVSVPVWIYVGFWGVHQSKDIMSYIKSTQLGLVGIVAGLIIALFLFLYLKKRIFKNKVE